MTQEPPDQNIALCSTPQVALIGELRFEHRRDALGIGTPRPRLSWIVEAEAVGWLLVV